MTPPCDKPTHTNLKNKVEQNLSYHTTLAVDSEFNLTMENMPVYNTVGTKDIQQILHKLNEENELYELVPGFHNTKPLAVLDHFKAVADRDLLTHSRVLFVVDREAVEKHGLLLILTSHHGFLDAVRRLLNEDDTGGLGAALENGCQNWEYVREMPHPSDPLKPYRRYAVYNSALGLENSPNESIQITTYDSSRYANPRLFDLLQTLSRGLDELYPFSEDLPKVIPEDGRRAEGPDIYVGVTTTGKSIDEIKTMHVGIAKENNLDQDYFIIIDQSWETEGLLFVKLQPEDKEEELQRGNDEFRHPATSVKAGELLNWIFMGLMTWEDAKASDPVDVEEQRKLNEETAQREFEEHRKMMDEYDRRQREAEAQGEPA